MHVGLYNFQVLLNQWRGVVLLTLVAAAWALQRFALVECLAATVAVCAIFLGGFFIKWHFEYDFSHWPAVALALALPAAAWLLCRCHPLRAHRRTIWVSAATALFVLADGHLDYAAIFSPGRQWQVIAGLALIGRFGWWLARNDDIAEHRGPLRFILICSCAAFLGGWFLGRSTGHPAAGLVCGSVMALVPCFVGLRLADRAFGDLLGGLIFDMVFCEGDFAETKRQTDEPPPNVTLLRHWRETGSARKAWRAAKRSLVEDPQYYPVWLFAAETAVLRLGRPRRAIQIVRRLDRSEAFTRDQKQFAVQELKSWLAVLGRNLDPQQFHSNQDPVEKGGPLKKAARLRLEGRFKEAVSLLESLRAADPENLAAALLLMRVHAQDLKNLRTAENILAGLEDQPHVAAGFVEYARRSIPEWDLLPPAATEQKRTWFRRGGKEAAVPEKIVLGGPPGVGGQPPDDTATIESLLVANPPARRAAPQGEPAGDDVDSLLKNGYLGTAIELLNQQIKAKPDSFDLWMKLADAHANRCGDLHTSMKIIQKMERSAVFTEDQIGQAQARLKEWCAGKSRSLYGV
jgi:tetratricopeptide (TPR) repeat protein